MLPRSVLEALGKKPGDARLSSMDAASIFINQDTPAFGSYVHRVTSWLQAFYDARRYYRKQVAPNKGDHRRAAANPGGWAGPAMLVPAMMIAGRGRLVDDEVFIGAGVFKGGSTACIAPICKEESITYVAADTFDGLPSSSGDGIYSAGQFKGRIEEVQEHLKTLNSHLGVEYAVGLFGDTLKSEGRPVAAMFLDTDLYESSRSALEALAGSIDENTIILSDGISPNSDFRRHVFCPRTPEARAIGDYFGSIGMPLIGSHSLQGHMAVFHHPDCDYEPFNPEFYHTFSSLATLTLLGGKSEYPLVDVMKVSGTGSENLHPALFSELVRQISYRHLG